MFNLTVENAKQQKLTLTQNESKYQVVQIDGLNPPKATIHSSPIAGMDGTRYASSRLEERNIVLTVKINGDIEINRVYLYNFLRTKQYCKIYFKNGTRNVFIEGYVETMENSLFENGQKMQVSIICQDPYFKSLKEIAYDISQVVGAFKFPFAFGAKRLMQQTITDDAIEFSTIEKNRQVNVINSGDDVGGFTIEIKALGLVENPVIYNVDNNERIGLNTTLLLGDLLTIKTEQGKKSITLTRNGIDVNYLRYLKRDSSWLQLQVGDNQFTYSAESGSEFMQVIFRFNNRYEGV